VVDHPAHGKDHGIEPISYAYARRGCAKFLQTVLKHSFSAAMMCLMLNIALGLSQ